MSYQVEQHRGVGGAEERSAGLDVTPAELPAGVCRDQIPDPGEKESHRRHPVHGQRPGRRDGSAETPLHHGGSPLCPGAQTAAPTSMQMAKGYSVKKEDAMNAFIKGHICHNALFSLVQEEAEHLATAHSGRAMEVLVPFDEISLEWEELKHTLQRCEDSLTVASRLQSFIQVCRNTQLERVEEEIYRCECI